jgi:glycosyltransferase involved in cell wall biosynthesis
MPARIVYIAPYYSEAARRDLRLTVEYKPAGVNKTMALVAAMPRGLDLTLVSTGYTRRLDFERIRRREETIKVKGCLVPVIYPGYRAARYLSFPAIAAAIFLECRRHRPDIIIFYNFRLESLIPALLAKLFGGARIICQFEDGLQVVFPPGSPRWLAFQAMYRLGKMWSDGFTLINGSLRGEFPASRSVVIPLILPDEARAGYSPVRLDLRRKPVVKVAYSGSLDRERGADVFLNSARLFEGNPRFRFYVTGQGPLQDQVVRQAATGENLEYAGLLDDRRYGAFLSDMDIFVNPQKLSHPFARYSFPSKMIRYILMNKPIVSTAFSDISGVPAHGLFFFGNDDPRELARVLAELAVREIVVDYQELLETFSETNTRAAIAALLKQVRGLRPACPFIQR